MPMKSGLRVRPLKTLRSPWILRALISLKSVIITNVLKIMVKCCVGPGVRRSVEWSSSILPLSMSNHFSPDTPATTGHRISTNKQCIVCNGIVSWLACCRKHLKLQNWTSSHKSYRRLWIRNLDFLFTFISNYSSISFSFMWHITDGQTDLQINRTYMDSIAVPNCGGPAKLKNLILKFYNDLINKCHHKVWHNVTVLKNN